MAKYYRGLNVAKVFRNKLITKRRLRDYSPPYIDNIKDYQLDLRTGEQPTDFTSNTGGAGCQCGTIKTCSLVAAENQNFFIVFQMSSGKGVYDAFEHLYGFNRTRYNYGSYDWYESGKVAFRAYMSPSGNCTSGNYCGDNYQSLIYSGTIVAAPDGPNYRVLLGNAPIARNGETIYEANGVEDTIYFFGPSGGNNVGKVVQYTGGTGIDNWGKAGWYKVEIDGPGGSVKSPWIALYTYTDNTTTYECDCTNEECTCDPGGYTQTEACCCFDCSGDGITCCDDPPGNPVSNCCRGECSPGDPGYACGYDYSCDPPNSENCSPGGCDTCYTYCYANCTDVKGTCT